MYLTLNYSSGNCMRARISSNKLRAVCNMNEDTAYIIPNKGSKEKLNHIQTHHTHTRRNTGTQEQSLAHANKRAKHTQRTNFPRNGSPKETHTLFGSDELLPSQEGISMDSSARDPLRRFIPEGIQPCPWRRSSL